ncbi:MAG TPA: hypothetical protein VK781_10755 [Solirubrobacteraceae bacterium]|jgi:hypothetical protein|nr:hypothetical protein [Solirubrobacteraceae bacterium]
MTLRTRIWLLGTVACAVVGLSAPVAAQGAFGVESFFAANCKVATCNKAPTPAEEKKKAEEEGYSQAAGHPPFGITDFKLNRVEAQPGLFVPQENLKSLRIDVAPGVSTNPEAVAKCTVADFTGTEVEPVKHIFTEPKCAESGAETTVIGENKVTTVLEVAAGVFADVPLSGKVYNLVQPDGLSSYFGVALQVGAGLFVHTFIEGHVEWASDYHDLFEIKNIPPGLLESRLAFFGNIGVGGFLSNPSNCAGTGPQTTTGWRGESYEGSTATSAYTTPIGTENCSGPPPFLAPFAPTFSLTPATKQSDQPDGITTELTLPHDPNPASLDSSQLKTASVELPEGMTLNPSAAQGLEACTPAQARIHSTVPGTACPTKSEIGSVTLDVPGLPAGSLEGKLYLGGPESGPITGPPYTMYIDAESSRYGISVRLKGDVVPNETTGRVTASFSENPEQPFSNLILHFKSGALAPIANPLTCGPATTNVSFSPFTGTPASVFPSVAPFTVDSNGAGGACPAPLPFTLTQSTASVPTTGGANTNFTFNLARVDGQQYLSRVSATLPPGLVGKIPAVPLCPEPQASLGTCSPASQIGTATATVGSGPAPIQFTGPVYLTGPTGNAPYGMTTVINAAVGPFSLGNDVVRTGIEVDPITARVTVAGDVPTIFKGIPLRMKALSVAVNRQGFLVNPTNCGALATNTTLTSSFGTTQNLSTPFQATNCSGLAFKPKFTATSNAKTSRANGAALNVKVGYPTGAQANIKSVLVTVPKQLPSRLSTLNKACLEKVFNANPYSCPTSSRVGGATVVTPVLPNKLTGPAYFVSHGGAKFPDLDLVLSGNGVTVIMVGNTNIQKGVTTSNFAAVPDVPVTSFETNLPVGKNSAVTAVGSLCKQSLIMPTTITAQNGKVIKQNTAISVSGCPVTVLSQRVSGHKALITVRVPAAGRVSGSGKNLKTVYKRPGKAGKVTLQVPLSGAGVNALDARSPLAVRVRIGFIPKAKGASSSANSSVVFK